MLVSQKVHRTPLVSSLEPYSLAKTSYEFSTVLRGYLWNELILLEAQQALFLFSRCRARGEWQAFRGRGRTIALLSRLAASKAAAALRLAWTQDPPAVSLFIMYVPIGRHRIINLLAGYIAARVQKHQLALWIFPDKDVYRQ